MPAGATAATAAVELGSMTLGDIISGTFNSYGNAFWKYVAIVAIVEGILFVVGAVTFLAFGLSLPGIADFVAGSTWVLPPTAMGGFIAAGVVLGLGSIVATTLQQGALIHATSEQTARHTLGFGRAFGAAWRRLAAMIAASLLLVLAIGVAVGIIVALGLLGGPLVILGVLVAIPVALFFGVRWAFVLQAVVIEGAGPIEALSRSWSLVQGNWWRVFGIMLVVSLILVGISLAAGLLGLIPFLGWIIQLVVPILLTPIAAIAQTLLYFDLRHPEKGFTTETLAKELGL
jgi:hypothetical protein